MLELYYSINMFSIIIDNAKSLYLKKVYKYF